MSQLELFAQSTAVVSPMPSVASVRARVEKVLNELRSADAPPWSAKELARWKVVVPQMADWLPVDEGDAVRAEFARLLRGL